MHATSGQDGGASRRSLRGRPRRRVSVFGVLGEILITLGVVTLLYVAWQLWIGDYLIGNQMKSQAQALSEQWDRLPSASASPTPDASPTPSTITTDPPVMADPGDAQIIGNVWIPRFGANYVFTLAGGVSASRTLDPIGIGHYPDTVMPGATGNFAIAGHRGSHGAPFQDLPALHIGDAVVIETQDGWYTYRFRNLEYVAPTQVDVLLPVPQNPNVQATGKYITMTTCSPRYGSAERAIAYGVFESFTPRAAGRPASLTEGVTS